MLPPSTPPLTPQIKGSGSHLRPVKDKVRAAVKKRRLRLEEFFEPFDATHTKKVLDACYAGGYCTQYFITLPSLK